MKDLMEIGVHGYEKVVRARIGERGLTVFIVVHDTTLGPALGGVRMWPFASEEEALQDALRLARDMTFKAAAAGLKLGGGKAVIIGDANLDKSEQLFRDFGNLVESLEGQYIASEDVGTAVADIDIARQETTHVVGTDPRKGGSGDPSPMTALGVFHGMRACIEEVGTVAIQGAGKVGSALARMLADAGVDVIIADVDVSKAIAVRDACGATVCEPDEIHQCYADVFSPCALGGLLNVVTIEQLNCKVIAGGANNQLAERELADRLHERGILYAPDYVINAGGLINVASELAGFDRDAVEKRVIEIHDRLKDILQHADNKGITPLHAADLLVASIIAEAHQSA